MSKSLNPSAVFHQSSLYGFAITSCFLVVFSAFLYFQPRARICKRVRSSGIDAKESIPPAYVAWWPVRQIGLLYQPARLQYIAVLRIRIRDPGSGAFLTPGSGIRNRFFSGSQSSDLGSRISDPGSRIPDPGSRIPDPGSQRAY
jgi:hypothetical protein